MNKVLLSMVAALTLAVVGLGAYIALDDDSAAQAANPIDCSVVLGEGTETVTCTGTVNVPGPFQGTVSFTLVVTANDNPPTGPSFNDDITSCTLDVGNGPQAISYGPCP